MNSNVALIILTILFVIYIVIDRLADKTQQKLIEMQGDLIGLQDGLITEQRQYICMLRKNQKDIWIPCTEELPEKKAQKYLIYYQDYLNGGYDYAVTPYIKTPYRWEFAFYNESNNCEVIAWMPLPEPYCSVVMKGADDE